MKDCTTCKYGYEDERLGILMCHHPSRFSEDCIDFNMHEEKEIKELEKPVPNDIEEATESHAKTKYGLTRLLGAEMKEVEDDFIAGAKWQEKRNLRFVKQVLSGDFTVFEAGRKYEKEQMMKEAVEGEVIVPIYEGNDVWSAEIKIPGRYVPGDKVRIIIVKEDEHESKSN